MTRPKTIYIIDDEPTLREVVRRYLEREGYTIIEAETGPKALALLNEHPADLILLDIMLPGLDGFTLARSIRNQSSYASLNVAGDVPIIMLTSRGDEADRIAGFELGVDDYVIKPFSPRELVARVKAVLRRAQPASDRIEEQPLTFPTLLIDPNKRSVIVRGGSIDLTVKEFDLLWMLARSPQQVFTRDQLLNRIWGYEFYGDSSTVTVHIRRLREKIEIDPSNPLHIQTVWGLGYKFEPQ
jgi:DNA-binding response OmpR family regulator